MTLAEKSKEWEGVWLYGLPHRTMQVLDVESLYGKRFIMQKTFGYEALNFALAMRMEGPDDFQIVQTLLEWQKVHMQKVLAENSLQKRRFGYDRATFDWGLKLYWLGFQPIFQLYAVCVFWRIQQ